jgi:hypothetical protein
MYRFTAACQRDSSRECQLSPPAVLLCILAALLLAGCEVQKSRNPLSPDVAGPIRGVEITAPKPLEPVDGAEITNDRQPLQLKLENALTTGERPLWHQIEIATDATFGSRVHLAERVNPGANGQTMYDLPQSLAAGRTYYWRARALDGANTGPYSAPGHFQIVEPVVIETPIPASPIGGEPTPTNRPEFVVTNGKVSGPAAGPVAYRFEVALNEAFTSVAAVVTVSRSDGQTTVMSMGELPYGVQFFWRVRATDGVIDSAWSAVQAFRTPAPPAAPPPPTPAPSPGPSPAPGPTPPSPSPSPSPLPSGGSRTPDPPPGQRLPLPDMYWVVQQVANERPDLLQNSCQEPHWGGHPGNWGFMDMVVDRLRLHDTRWGYNWKRGNVGDPSMDVIAYHWGPGPDEGSTNVYLIDIIVGHCGPSPGTSWYDVTDITYQSGTVGRWTGRGRF